MQHAAARCRNKKKAEAAAREIARAVGSKSTVPCYTADLASLDETKALAHQVAKDHPSLDILVNNAGEVLPAPCQPCILQCQLEVGRRAWLLACKADMTDLPY